MTNDVNMLRQCGVDVVHLAGGLHPRQRWPMKVRKCGKSGIGKDTDLETILGFRAVCELGVVVDNVVAEILL